MKLSKKHLYWLLQIIGWGISPGLNLMAKMFLININLSKYYIVAENLTLFITGILASHLLRYVLKYHIKWKKWNLKKALLILLLTILLIVVMSVLIEALCAMFYAVFEAKDIERSSLNYLTTFANSMFYLVSWQVLYWLVKTLLRTQAYKLERLRLENSVKESQLNTLKGQVNPHFMFNSLNNIRGLMLEDVDKARDMLTQLSDMLRFSLARKNDDFVPLHEELSVVRNYIALSKIQLEDRLQYEEQISENVKNLEVPPMLIQMLIENAIKHGVSNLKNGGLVLLEVDKRDSFIQIKIVNDGHLTSKTSGTKIGVENIEQRLQLLYDKKASFDLIEKENRVIATVQIPIS